MKVLVTGATGFLGGWLCKALVKEGHSVHALVRPSSNTSELQKLSVHLHKGDVTDLHSFMSAASGEIEVLFHLAGLVAYAERLRPAMQAVNVGGTANAIEVCRQRNIRLVYMSSVAAVGASLTSKVLNEESPYEMDKFRFGYFDTKRKAEVLVRQACQKGDLFAVILNPSNVYGAGDMRKASRRTHIWVATGRLPFYTSGGLSVVNVESVIETTIQAVQKGRSGERYILSGENISIQKLFQLVAEAAGSHPPYIRMSNFVLDSLVLVGQGLKAMGFRFFLNDKDMRLGRFYHWFDHSKASAELDFSPQPAAYAISNSIEWWKKHCQSKT